MGCVRIQDQGGRQTPPCPYFEVAPVGDDGGDCCLCSVDFRSPGDAFCSGELVFIRTRFIPDTGRFGWIGGNCSPDATSTACLGSRLGDMTVGSDVGLTCLES